jgi:hypothetical protein
MIRKLVSILFIILLMIAFIACGNGEVIDNTESTVIETTKTTISETIEESTPETTSKLDPNDELMKLLPDKIGFIWLYSGFAEYGHTMELIDIIRDNNEVKYIIEGIVTDGSGGTTGESPEAYDIKIEYSIKDNVLLRTKTEKKMFDSFFDKIELIRLPLELNMKWTQTAIDKEGNEAVIDSEIIAVEVENEKKIYTVKYQHTSSEYYEIRKIMEGVGVVSYTRLWKDLEGNSFDIGYSLIFDG